MNSKNQICKNLLSTSSNNSLQLFDCSQIASKILEKYKFGVTFVDAEWTGDYNLSLDSNFRAKSQYDEDGIEEIYECVSSEITYDTRFKQKIKGRESFEITHDNCRKQDCIYSTEEDEEVKSKTA